jgi:hypothetical protein
LLWLCVNLNSPSSEPHAFVKADEPHASGKVRRGGLKPTPVIADDEFQSGGASFQKNLNLSRA